LVAVEFIWVALGCVVALRIQVGVVVLVVFFDVPC